MARLATILGWDSLHARQQSADRGGLSRDLYDEVIWNDRRLADLFHSGCY